MRRPCCFEFPSLTKENNIVVIAKEVRLKQSHCKKDCFHFAEFILTKEGLSVAMTFLPRLT